MLSLLQSQKPSARSADQVSASLAAGLLHHHAGRLPEAKSCYSEILQIDPEHPDALHLLGVINQQSGQYDLAAQLIRSAILRSPFVADYHANLGNTLRLQNNLPAAIDSYRTAISLEPDHLDAYHSLANALADQNEFPEAELCFRRVLQLQPDHAEALYNLGNTKMKQADLPAAIDCYRQAIHVLPNRPEFHFNLAHALKLSGSLSEAAGSYNRVLSLAANDFDANFELGILLHEQKEFSAAADAFRRAITLKPDHSEALSNLAASLQELDEFPPAADLLLRAISLNPDCAEAHSNMGGNLWRQGNMPAALESCRRAITLNPNLSGAHGNMGHVLFNQSDIRGALHCYDRALVLKPDAPSDAKPGRTPWKRGDLLRAFDSCRHLGPDVAIAEYRRALASKANSAEILYYVGLMHLLQGDFAAGWENYEYRWHTKTLRSTQRHFQQPLWRGEPLEGARILLHAEQGIGDTTQFVRYASMVAARHSTVILEVQPELRRLFAGVDGATQVLARGDPLPAFDWHSPLISLPFIFQTDLTTIPAKIPYLHPDPALVQEWSRHLQSAGLRVGLIWSGSPRHTRDPQRSIPLDQLRPIVEIDRVTFYSLQKGPAAQQLPGDMNLMDLSPQLHDFADTAAVISNLDLVLSVDTSVAHVAGALGKPVWILLTHSPDWRWLLDRDESPWYPTARLFRQSAPGDWSSVIDQVAHELRQAAFTPTHSRNFRTARSCVSE